MKKKRLSSFHNLELKIWGDKCETNPYFATISIIFLTVFGCIIGGDATINFVSGDRILESVDGKLTNILYIYTFVCGYNIAESFISMKTISSAICRMLLISFILALITFLSITASAVVSILLLLLFVFWVFYFIFLSPSSGAVAVKGIGSMFSGGTDDSQGAWSITDAAGRKHDGVFVDTETFHSNTGGTFHRTGPGDSDWEKE